MYLLKSFEQLLLYEFTLFTHVSQHASPSVVMERLTIGAGVVASEN